MPSSPLSAREQALATHYRRVQHERMQGLPLLNPALAVETVGFAWTPQGEAAEPVGEGVLITPWFMSLVRLPAEVQPAAGRVGRRCVHAFGCERFDFLGAWDAVLGFHESCALFSPMQGFDSQALARATACEALALTRPAVPVPPEPPALSMPQQPGRRAFLAGRRAA